MIGFTKSVTDGVAGYVGLRPALGCAFTKQAAIREHFGRFIAHRSEAGPLTQDVVLAYVLGCQVTRTRVSDVTVS